MVYGTSLLISASKIFATGAIATLGGLTVIYGCVSIWAFMNENEICQISRQLAKILADSRWVRQIKNLSFG